MAVVWSRAAPSQVARALDCVEDFHPQAAAELARRLVAEADSLAHFPYRGRPVPGTDLRELVVVPPYVLRYRIKRDGEVQIVRVRHASRRPTVP